VSALQFNVVYEDAGEGWVYAHVPELPDVQTHGEDLQHARAMVPDAISMVLEERRAGGELIPEPGWALVESVQVPARRSEISSDTYSLMLPSHQRRRQS
jgi:predicted RNase H-like HicB family nuclease